MARKIIGEILREGRRFFSLNFAASQCGYSKEYFRQLILKEKLKAEMINGNWFISEVELTNLRQQLGTNGVNIIKYKNNEIAELKEEVKRLRDGLDPWDRLFLNLPDEDSAKIKTPANLGANYLPVKIINRLILLFSFFILLAGLFFYRHPESIYANFRDFRNFSNQVSAQASGLKNSLQTSAVLAAVSFQKAAVSTAADIQETAVDFKETAYQTALNFPDQTLNLAKQTLNQVRSLSLSLSLSLSANKLICSANKSPNS